MSDTMKALLAIIVINMAATCVVIVLFDVFKPPLVPLEAHKPAVPPEIKRGPVNVVVTNSYANLVPPKDWSETTGYFPEGANEQDVVVLSSAFFTNWIGLAQGGYDSNRPAQVFIMENGSRLTNRMRFFIRKAVVYRYCVLGFRAKDGTPVPIAHGTISEGQITQTNGVDTLGPLEEIP